ncbi:cobalamin-binding protein [Bacillus pinisoli]|uniref:cobalamin-binding protein n=1 Tax=Bacillus pinisoli TaxID=2901866 RepID=UPI001FF619FE|nr:cobalamin-binding protein [Bacillus pinisoli]
MRLISICPSNTELLAYLGLEQSLVGIDDYSDWPSHIQTLPRLGPDLSINIDKVEELKPDLVLASLSVPGMEKNIEELKKRNIPHIVLNPQSLDDIAEDLLLVGKRTGTAEIAEKIVKHYRHFISNYQAYTDRVNTISSLYWEWWPKPIFSPGGVNWLTEISSLAGAQNVFSHVKVASHQTNWEEIVSLDPDHICLVWVGVEQKKMNPALVRKRPGAEKMQAMINNQIHILDEPLYCRPSPRLLLGLKKLASLLHPSVFPADDGVDPLLSHLEKKRSS